MKRQKRSRDRQENGKCTNATNRRSREACQPHFTHRVDSALKSELKSRNYNRRLKVPCANSVAHLTPQTFRLYSSFVSLASLGVFFFLAAKAAGAMDNASSTSIFTIELQRFPWFCAAVALGNVRIL